MARCYECVQENCRFHDNCNCPCHKKLTKDIKKLKKEEKLENEVLELLQDFSKNDFHNYSTSFQRYKAKTVIELVRKYDE